MKTLFKGFICTAALFFAGWWLFGYNEDFVDTITAYVENNELLTLEAHFSAEQIMESHRPQLLLDSRYQFQEPHLLFYPYLLMRVKYTFGPEKKPREGLLLWSSVDGEMVFNSETWETSRGFFDALVANASSSDFLLILALAKRGGPAPKELIQKEVNLELQDFEKAVESAQRKHLIISQGGNLALHMQNPFLPTVPETIIKQRIVKKEYNSGDKIAKRFRKAQIESILQAAFGKDFVALSCCEVYLPVYSLEVLNPDGTKHKSFWNALTNKSINSSPFFIP